jgi:hypothetical protein
MEPANARPAADGRGPGDYAALATVLGVALRDTGIYPPARTAASGWAAR